MSGVGGGTGKSTLAALLTRRWRQDGLSVRLLDVDPEGASVRRWWNPAWAGPPISVVGSGEMTVALDSAGRDQVDVVVVDLPPMFASDELRWACARSTTVLVVASPSSWNRLASVHEGYTAVVREARAGSGSGEEAGLGWPSWMPIVVNRYQAVHARATDRKREEADSWGARVLKQSVPDFGIYRPGAGPLPSGLRGVAVRLRLAREQRVAPWSVELDRGWDPRNPSAKVMESIAGLGAEILSTDPALMP